MKQNKLIGIIMSLFILFAVPLTVFANENNGEELVIATNEALDVITNVEVNPEDVISVDEERIISDIEGAKVRLTQLQIAVESHIEGANSIIAELQAQNASVNYDRLYEIVNEFESLLIDIENTNLDQDANILAKEFVELKSDAIALTKEFRELVKDSMTEARKEQIRERLEAKKEQVKEKHQERLNQLRNNYNAKKAGDLAKKLGMNPDELKNQIESGNLTIQEIKNEIKAKYDNLSDEEKTLIKQEIAEEKKKLQIEAKQRIEERKNQIQERNKERKEILNERFEANKEQIRQRIENNPNLNESQKEKVRNAINNANLPNIDNIMKNNPQMQKRLDEIKANSGKLPKDLDGLDVNVQVGNTNGGNE